MYTLIHLGSVSDGMAIYDTLKFMECDVTTYCIGMGASMGAVLLTKWNKRVNDLHFRIVVL